MRGKKRRFDLSDDDDDLSTLIGLRVSHLVPRKQKPPDGQQIKRMRSVDPMDYVSTQKAGQKAPERKSICNACGSANDESWATCFNCGGKLIPTSPSPLTKKRKKANVNAVECPSCKAEINDPVLFCRNCGAFLRSVAADSFDEEEEEE